MWVKWCWCVVTTMLVVSVVVRSGDARSDVCNEVAQQLMNIAGPSSDLLHQPTLVGEAAACSGGPCCRPEQSAALQQHSVQHMQHAVAHAAARISSALHARAAALTGAITEALDSSEQETLKVFTSSYPRLTPHVTPILRNLFSGLKASIAQPDSAGLETALAQFWNDLFPTVYHSAVHAKMPQFTEQYAQCVRASTKIIKPWGIIPALVDDPVSRFLESARLLLRALETAATAAKTPESFVFPDECIVASTRMSVCGLCNAVSAQPCHNLCLNVARGCLAPLAEIGAGWSDLVNGVARASKALKAARPVLDRLPDHLPDAVLVAMETGPKLQKKVRRQCGLPTHVTQPLQSGGGSVDHMEPPPLHHSKHSTSSAPQDVDVSQHSPDNNEANVIQNIRPLAWAGDAIIKQVVKELYSSRQWFQELPNAVCHNTSKLQHDQLCWNGEKLAPYTRDLAATGVAAQKYNPELRVAHPDAGVYATADELRAVKQTIMSRITWLPASDSQMRKGYADADANPATERRHPDGGSGGSFVDEDGEDDEDGDYDGSGYASGDGANDVTEEGSRVTTYSDDHESVQVVASGSPGSVGTSLYCSFLLLPALLYCAHYP
ncbi:glypican-5 [Hyalella azteca]|uniref:Glypican-5 n=1 Tax=Hyalella azteca TaxID=294128 RepID=A0A8B7PA84_HYAAZ|nr:glypican-5 [Hyalella azteca]